MTDPEKIDLVRRLLDNGIEDIKKRYDAGERVSNDPDPKVKSVEDALFRYASDLEMLDNQDQND